MACGGGERVLEHFCALFPDADLHTLLYEAGKVSPTIRRMRVIESKLGRISFAKRHYRQLLPLLPAVVRSLPTRDYDLVISTSHCVAKGAPPPRRGRHLSYVFSPMRYVWDHFPDYLSGSWWKDAGLRLVRAPMQRWDVRSCRGVDAFAADSHHIAEKIRRFWGRSAEAIHPPVDLDHFTPSNEGPEEYFLVVSALVPYKKVDRAVEAANLTGQRLIVVGTGPEEARLRQLAGRTVEFAGFVPDAELPRYYRAARALLFPGVEDYGITALEAQACGRPVLALGAGGVTETVKDGISGTFFRDPTVKALARLMREHDDSHYDPAGIRRHAESFSPARFREAIMGWISKESRFSR
jgi:glycosyltransferase involved in cell wall biosynthesis